MHYITLLASRGTTNPQTETHKQKTHMDIYTQALSRAQAHTHADTNVSTYKQDQTGISYRYTHHFPLPDITQQNQGLPATLMPFLQTLII
jgi:hypothetical protein